MDLLMAAPGHQLLPFKQWQSPSALCALAINMLLAHAMPHKVVVSKTSPSSADLSSFAERYGVEITEDLVGEFGGKGGKEVDLELLLDLA